MSLSANRLPDPIPRGEAGGRKATRNEIHRILKEEKGEEVLVRRARSIVPELVGDHGHDPMVETA
jgi:hypothetical protein